ncbi:MAG: response regulator transcription factor [Planctomycetes bacterium]|nr:response regulator transcription factor [Planctomycetota bacterium]
MPDDGTVFVVDDDAAMRHSLRRLIGSVGLKVETKKSAEEFLADVDPGWPGCLVLDVRMHGKSGLDLQEELARRDAARPIIFITAHGDVPMAVRALQGGAVDFLEKPFRSQLLLDRIRQALDRDQRERTRRAEQADLDARIGRLTPREREILEMVVAGMTSRQIAEDLGLSPKTVHVHRASAMARLGARSVADMVRLAVIAGVAPR